MAKDKDVDPLYALYHQEPDPEAIKLAHVLLGDPWGIPYVMELPKQGAVPVLRALAALIVAMKTRLAALEALHHMDDRHASAVTRWLHATYAAAAAEEAKAAAGPGVGELAGERSGEELIDALRTPEVFELLVDRLPQCTQKDLLKVWGYVRGIYPRLPDNVPPGASLSLSAKLRRVGPGRYTAHTGPHPIKSS